MPLASLPGPVTGQWHLGPVPVHGYALCVVLGVLTALWVCERRYRAVGGMPWLMLDLATIAVPAALIGARLYRVLTDYDRFFGPHRDWVDILRIWDGGLGVPGAVAGGMAAALILCRRNGTAIGPVLCASVPGLAFGQAVAVLGNWFSQSLYGPPSSMPWAVPIAPRFRVTGYQDFGTFQPLFIYESLWDVVIGVALIRIIRTRRPTGGQALAIGAGLYAIGRLAVVSLLLSGSQQRTGTLTEQVLSVVAVAAAAGYLYATRGRRGPQPLTVAAQRPAPRPAPRPSVAGSSKAPYAEPDGQAPAVPAAPIESDI